MRHALSAQAGATGTGGQAARMAGVGQQTMAPGPCRTAPTTSVPGHPSPLQRQSARASKSLALSPGAAAMPGRRPPFHSLASGRLPSARCTSDTRQRCTPGALQPQQRSRNKHPLPVAAICAPSTRWLLCASANALACHAAIQHEKRASGASSKAAFSTKLPGCHEYRAPNAPLFDKAPPWGRQRNLDTPCCLALPYFTCVLPAARLAWFRAASLWFARPCQQLPEDLLTVLAQELV